MNRKPYSRRMIKKSPQPKWDIVRVMTEDDRVFL